LNSVNVNIKESSWLAWLAARKLKVKSVAITIGQTVYLHNVSAETFKNDVKWLTHELEHVKQFRRYGFFNFIFRYLWESIRKGYYNNKFEIEARNSSEFIVQSSE